MRYHWVKKEVTVGIMLLFVATCIVSTTAQTAVNPTLPALSGKWLFVGGSGPGNYSKIQDAIDDSLNGDTVFVYDDSSPYYENIIVNKSISVFGENKTTTSIDGIVGGNVVSVQADGVRISGFSIQYHCTFPSSDIALKANHTSISQMIMDSNNWVGISLFSCCDTNIIDNHISNKYAGISLDALSNNNTITGNDLSNNNYGLEIKSSFHNHIFYNNFENNTISASDYGCNTWNSEYPSAGNYWDTYTGTDTLWGPSQNTSGADGVGDTPTYIPGGENQDYYPLMEPYTTTQLAFHSSVGGIGISGIIKNIGNTTAFRVCWRNTFTGGFILIGKETLRVIQKPLLPGEEAIVKVFVVGFGKTILSMMLWADNAPRCSGNWSATVLLIFVLGIR